MNKSQMKTLTQKNQAQAVDRVGYPCGSTLNFTMQKYYNDIGSRLSEMHLPEQLTNNTNEDLSQDFCMLTIDTRHLRSVKQRTHSEDSTSVSRDESRSNDDDSAEVSTSESEKPAFRNMSNVSSYRKQRLLEKLTCSLFLKKHMCARCKRKSRSCISNKTYSGTEKLYMCFRCRETSQKNHIFDEHYHFNDSELSHSTSGQIFDSQSKENIIPILRKNIKDSGYDTVTSCSTVASAYSAFSTPAITKHHINKDKTTTKPVLYGDQAPHSQIKSTVKSNGIKTKCKPTAHKPCVHSPPNDISHPAQDSDTELSDIISTSQPGSTEEEVRHAKQRNATRYDGYLTQMDYSELDHNKPRPILSDTSNVDDGSGNGDTCYFPPRIIRVSQPGVDTTKDTTAAEKSCYTCESTTKPCFRLPWAGGWICEDCLDGLH